jgi:hypothetical protein
MKGFVGHGLHNVSNIVDRLFGNPSRVAVVELLLVLFYSGIVVVRCSILGSSSSRNLVSSVLQGLQLALSLTLLPGCCCELGIGKYVGLHHDSRVITVIGM